MSQKHLIIDAYGDWVENYINDGWDGYLLSFMFNQLIPRPVKLNPSHEGEGRTVWYSAYRFSLSGCGIRGNRDGLLRQMEREVERVYATLLTRVVREPTHKKNKDLLPRWIICPDFPVPKHSKMSLRDVTLNDGLHLQGVGVQPAGSRLKEGLDEHFERYHSLYIKVGGALRGVTATPITHKPKYVVGYGFKMLSRGRASFDDVLVYPRTLGEIKDQRRDL
jgi:hypothetical protein